MLNWSYRCSEDFALDAESTPVCGSNVDAKKGCSRGARQVAPHEKRCRERHRGSSTDQGKGHSPIVVLVLESGFQLATFTCGSPMFTCRQDSTPGCLVVHGAYP